MCRSRMAGRCLLIFSSCCGIDHVADVTVTCMCQSRMAGRSLLIFSSRCSIDHVAEVTIARMSRSSTEVIFSPNLHVLSSSCCQGIQYHGLVRYNRDVVSKSLVHVAREITYHACVGPVRDVLSEPSVQVVVSSMLQERNTMHAPVRSGRGVHPPIFGS